MRQAFGDFSQRATFRRSKQSLRCYLLINAVTADCLVFDFRRVYEGSKASSMSKIRLQVPKFARDTFLKRSLYNCPNVFAWSCNWTQRSSWRTATKKKEEKEMRKENIPAEWVNACRRFQRHKYPRVKSIWPVENAPVSSQVSPISVKSLFTISTQQPGPPKQRTVRLLFFVTRKSFRRRVVSRTSRLLCQSDEIRVSVGVVTRKRGRR